MKTKKKTKTTKLSDVELESDIHENIDSLIQGKSTTITDNASRLERYDIVHAFTNMRDTLTEEERNEEGIQEIINFGTTFRSAQINIAPLESIVTGTDSVCEIVVDFNDPNRDHLVGVDISNAANQWLFQSNEKFLQFWRTAVGVGYLSGGGPAIFDEQDVGLFPVFNKNFLFPKGTSLDPDEMTYAYERREFTINQLKELIANTDDDDKTVSKEALESIIEEVKSQIEGNSASRNGSTEGVDLEKNSARDDSYSKATFEIWGYWEVRCYPDDHSDKKKRGMKYVSHILFTDKCVIGNNDKKEGGEQKAILFQEEIAFENPADWLVMLVFDEEIGGEKTVDTLRGIAEAFYKPAVKVEEFFNKKLEGALASSVPYLIEKEGANPDDVLDFEFGDPFLPKGTEFAQVPNTARELNPVISDLMGTVSGIASSGQSNTGRGQELRQQAVERQDNSTIIKTNRIIRAYMKLDRILDLIIGRALTLDAEPGTKDYRIIKGFQECVDNKLIEIFNLIDELNSDGEEDEIGDRKSAKQKAKEIRLKLGERSYGRFKNILVKARRSASGLDRPSEVENASFILRLVETGRVPAQNVPALIQRAVAYQTQNTDIAELAASTPELIQSDQRERAAAEWVTIGRRAIAGEILEIGPRDIDEDHVESHKIDLIADVNLHGLRPWDQADVVMFTARVNHTGSHLERMRNRPESADIARRSMQEFQEIIRTAGQIIQLLEEEKAQSENQELSPDDQLKIAKTQKTYVEIELLGRNFGVDLEDKKDVMRNRLIRAQQNQERLNLMSRSQIVGEVDKHREFELKKQQAQQPTIDV